MPRHRAPGPKRGAPTPLNENTYGVAVRWDKGGKEVDLDLQAVIVDEKGLIVDAVYYNNLFALNGAVGLSGDNAEDESIWVRMEKLPPQVRLIIFVVAAYSGGSLRDVSNGRVIVLERRKAATAQLKEFKLERSRADADMVAMFKRFKDDTWGLVEIEEPAEHGSHFLDILEPTIGDLIRAEIPHAPTKLKVAFVMDKGAIVDFPQGDALRRLVVAVGGEFAHEDVPDDLSIELQAVFFSATGEMLGHVRPQHRGMFGVERLEDEMEDEEALSMDLMQVPPKVAQIFIVLLVDGGTFEMVETASARVIDQALHEIMRYEVKAAGHEQDSGLVLGRVLRKEKNRWGIETVGKFFDRAHLKEEMNTLASSMPVEAKRRKKKAKKDGTATPTPASPRSPKEPPTPTSTPTSTSTVSPKNAGGGKRKPMLKESEAASDANADAGTGSKPLSDGTGSKPTSPKSKAAAAPKDKKADAKGAKEPKDSKEGVKQESKEGSKAEAKERSKAESKDRSKAEAEDGSKAAPKEASKQPTKKDAKQKTEETKPETDKGKAEEEFSFQPLPSEHFRGSGKYASAPACKMVPSEHSGGVSMELTTTSQFSTWGGSQGKKRSLFGSRRTRSGLGSSDLGTSAKAKSGTSGTCANASSAGGAASVNGSTSRIEIKPSSIVVSLGEVPEAVRTQLALPPAKMELNPKPENTFSDGKAKLYDTADARPFLDPAYEPASPIFFPVCRGKCTFTPFFCVAEVSHSA